MDQSLLGLARDTRNVRSKIFQKGMLSLYTPNLSYMYSNSNAIAPALVLHNAPRIAYNFAAASTYGENFLDLTLSTSANVTGLHT